MVLQASKNATAVLRLSYLYSNTCNTPPNLPMRESTNYINNLSWGLRDKHFNNCSFQCLFHLSQCFIVPLRFTVQYVTTSFLYYLPNINALLYCTIWHTFFILIRGACLMFRHTHSFSLF